jgi:hypothetical protein
MQDRNARMEDRNAGNVRFQTEPTCGVRSLLRMLRVCFGMPQSLGRLRHAGGAGHGGEMPWLAGHGGEMPGA